MSSSRSPARASGATLLSVLALAGCSRPDGARAHEPVEPLSGAALDPAVRALVDEHLAPAREHPEDPELHATLGLVYEANAMWPEAARSFEHAAALEPDEPLWRLHQAIALQELGERERSLALLTAVAAELPDSAAVQQRLGEVLLGSGQVDAARERFRTTIRLDEERAEGWTGLGSAELQGGDAAAAASALERALRLDPTYKTAHYLLGSAYRELGRTEDAERELALGLEGRLRYLPDPLSGELRRFAVASTTRAQLALAHLEGGRAQRALNILEELHRLHPEDVTLLNNLSIALQRSGDPARAHEMLLEAQRLDPAEVTTWINLASYLLDQGMSARALEHADRAVELGPALAKTHLVRARVLLRQQRAEEALVELATSVRLDPRGAEALRLAGETALALQRFDEARAHFDALVRLRPTDPLARVGLAEIALGSGDRPGAERALAEARRIAPDHPRVVELARRLEIP